MKPPMFVRPLTNEERSKLEAGLHSSDSFVLRRCQILLSSSRGQSPAEIAKVVGRTPQTVRNVMRAFHQERLASLARKSSRPKTLRTIFDESGAAAVREMLHQSPRTFGKPTSIWTLAAQVSFEQGLSPYRVSTETIRSALKRLGKSWPRAKDWIVSPDPEYVRKKGREIG
jgi:transposase